MRMLLFGWIDWDTDNIFLLGTTNKRYWQIFFTLQIGRSILLNKLNLEIRVFQIKFIVDQKSEFP